MRNKFQILISIILTVLSSFVIFWLVLDNGKVSYKQESNVDRTEMLSKMDIIKEGLEKVYLNKVDEQSLNEGAIKGYVEGLKDPYTVYYTPKEFKELMEETTGEFVGIGIYLGINKKKQALVVGVIKEGPAEQAGLKAGDIIINVNDESVENLSIEQITDKIKGNPNTKVNIKVLRDGKEEKFEIIRQKVTIKHIESQMLENKVGYILINSFEGVETSKDFEKSYDNLIAEGMEKLVVDVRNNAGGILEQALEIGELFCDKDQKLIIVKNKDGIEKTTLSRRNKKIKIPTILLTNGYSASGSEVLAGILKENSSNVKLIGETTYGKGVVQTVIRLKDGSGLKVTTEEYFSPNHSKIHEVGITPDIEVGDYQYRGKLEVDKDTQLKKGLEELSK